MLHEHLPASIIAELKSAVRGDVRADALYRLLYSTDASVYRVPPRAVVVPRDGADVCAVVGVAARHTVPLVPRGGGTSLSGQSIGAGIVLDHSRHLNHILEINAAERWARVECGVVLDDLNAALLPHGLMIGPDPSSSMAATIGGMTANNSTGSHSIVYGMMVDHVREVEAVLSDGSHVTFGPRTAAQVAALAQRDTLEGALYRKIPRLLDFYEHEIRTRYPRTWRNVAGYNLNRLLAQRDAGQPFNLAPLLVGSEGTLGILTSITVNAVPRPKHTTLALIHFDDLRAGLEAVPPILEHAPSAVELLDRFSIRLTRHSPEYGPRLSFIAGDPRVVLVVEWAGNDHAELVERALALETQISHWPHVGAIVHQTTPEQIANVWQVRKAGLGLLMSKRGDAKPLAFVDDATVPIDHLADYALEVERVITEHGTEASFYAHASAGCLHINPLINLKHEHGLEQMQAISQAIAHLAIAHGGTTTGEHGEGLARSWYNQQLYGPELHTAFRQIKGLFDPDNIFNPGKIIDAPTPWQPEILRFNPQYTTPYAPTITMFDWSADGGFGGMVEMCNGQGMCRKTDAGVMCPSYRVTRDEAHSTRGRANALRAAISGELGPDGLASPELYEVLDLCLECKACKRECSSVVDMAKLKYEFLYHYQQQHGVPLRSRIFGSIGRLNQAGSLAPHLANWSFRNPLFRRVLDRTLGIDRRRSIPPLAQQPFRRWWRQHRKDAGRRGPIILWDDTWTCFNEPQIGIAAVRVLEAAGWNVHLVQDRRCCGRPMISKGLLEQARANAAHNVALLEPFAALGVPIIGLEPSCIASFRDEYPDLLQTEASRTVAAHSYFIEEFLADQLDAGLALPWREPVPAQRVLVHGHCYQKALITTAPLMRMLRAIPNATVEEILSGCCGMAGSFGYEREHYDVSLACGEERLFPAVRSADPDTIIVAAGTSCRHQIADGTQRQAIHPLVLLAEMLV